MFHHAIRFIMVRSHAGMFHLPPFYQVKSAANHLKKVLDMQGFILVVSAMFSSAYAAPWGIPLAAIAQSSVLENTKQTQLVDGLTGEPLYDKDGYALYALTFDHSKTFDDSAIFA